MWLALRHLTDCHLKYCYGAKCWNKICSSYAWETSQAQLPYFPSPFAFFAKIMLEGRDEIRGEGWANFITELYYSICYIFICIWNVLDYLYIPCLFTNFRMRRDSEECWKSLSFTDLGKIALTLWTAISLFIKIEIGIMMPFLPFSHIACYQNIKHQTYLSSLRWYF